MYENDIHYLVFVFFWYGYLEVSNNIFFRSWKYFKEFMQLFNKRDYLRYYLIVKVQRNFIPTEILFREQCPTCWPPFNFNKYVNTLFLLLFCLCSHCPIFLKLQFFLFLSAGHWLSEKIMFSTTTRFWSYLEKCVTM